MIPADIDELGGELWEPDASVEDPAELPLPGNMDYGGVDQRRASPLHTRAGGAKGKGPDGHLGGPKHPPVSPVPGDGPPVE